MIAGCQLSRDGVEDLWKLVQLQWRQVEYSGGTVELQ